MKRQLLWQGWHDLIVALIGWYFWLLLLNGLLHQFVQVIFPLTKVGWLTLSQVVLYSVVCYVRKL